MATPFLGEIVMFGGNFAPRSWAFCSGQLLPIAQNTALFSILGTTYGGDGRTTFALPDLRGRVPVHAGQGPGLSNYNLGQRGGSESVTLQANNIPPLPVTQVAGGTTNLQVKNANATTNIASGNFLANPQVGTNIYAPGPLNPSGSLAPATLDINFTQIANANSINAPVSILQPYLCVNFIIATQGIFPSRN